uniref:Uncharacterized protein n=1 Tax=Oryctolagus cuniculus TaxID=9986 RepID=A0A5F9C7Q1_RABIT
MVAVQAEPHAQFKLPSSGLLESLWETLIWSLLPCLLLPHQGLSWSQPGQHRLRTI